MLWPRLAELPTATEVGMNVLAPVADRGRLRPIISDGVVLGFSTGEFRVSDPESRKRAMHDRVGGTTCPLLTLEDVVTRESTSLKQAIARAAARRSSTATRSTGPASAVSAPPCSTRCMQKLRAAWKLLRDVGVRRFVFTADHGFLLIDEGARTAQVHGRKVDPKRRHVFSSVAADHDGEVRVPLSDLGYDSTEQLMFPETTALFDTGRRPTGFVHGGNSLQERVIPVLTLVHRRRSAGPTPATSSAPRRRRPSPACTASRRGCWHRPRGNSASAACPSWNCPCACPSCPRFSVEPCQTRGGAKIVAGSIVATVGESFELFFRLIGPADSKVLVEIYHQGAEADVVPCVVDGRSQ